MPPNNTSTASVAPVIAIVVCHNGELWLPEALEALEAQTVRPRRILAVDTGSTDDTPDILAEPLAEYLLDGVIRVDADTGFGAAVAIALNTAGQRWDDVGDWVWLLHDDCAPEPDCLATLVSAAGAGRSVGVLGPLQVDWTDPRLVVGAAVSTDSSGHRQTGLTRDELDWGTHAADEVGSFVLTTETLAVDSAGALVRRELWDGLGGYDLDLPLFGDDVDFGWRANLAGQAVLCVPGARMRHVRAASRYLRDASALGDRDVLATMREHGVRAYLANCGGAAYAFGVPRLLLLCVLRALGFGVLRRGEDAGTELRTAMYLLRGADGVRSARRQRRSASRGGSVSGLLTTRLTRLRNTARRGTAGVLRRQILLDSRLDPALLADGDGRVRVSPEEQRDGPWSPRGPRAVERAAEHPHTAMGLRRTSSPVVVALPVEQPVTQRPGSGPVEPEPEQPAEPAGAPATEPAAESSAAETSAAETTAAETTAVIETVPAETAETADTGESPEAATDQYAKDEDSADTAVTTDATETEAADTEAPQEKPDSGAATAASEVTAAPVVTEPEDDPARRYASAVDSDDPRTADAALLLLRVRRASVALRVLLAPPVVLLLALLAVSLIANAGRLGGPLAGGRVLPLPDLADLWTSYLQSWHPVAGGSSAPSPAALAVLGILSAPFVLIGGPGTAVTVLLLGAPPLAGLVAYYVSRRLPVHRWIRALIAAGYALLPPAVAAVAEGRLDAVVAHVLLPLVLAGVLSLLTQRRTVAAGTRWLSGAVLTAGGLAVIGAFAPLMHLLVLVVALVGFVVLAAEPGTGRRRAAGLFTIVLLPLLLLLPWPAVVLSTPSVLLFGVGARLDGGRPEPLDLLTLTPGGVGTLPYLGGLVLLAALFAVVWRARRASLPGLAVAVLGGAAAAVVYALPLVPPGGTDREYGWAGTPLLLVGFGLLWAVLGACQPAVGARSASVPKPLVGFAALTVAGLVLAALVAGGAGPLVTASLPTLAAAQQRTLTGQHGAVLVLGAPGEPVRQAAGRLPQFGDDDVPPVRGAAERLAGWGRDLRSGDPVRVGDAIASASVSGVRFLVLPDAATATAVRAGAGELVTPVPNASDGRPVLRLEPTGGSATLIAPQRSQDAVRGGAPPAEVDAAGVVRVDAAPPRVAVRVSPGPAGRLLVIGANEETSWQAEINGRPAPTVRAWGHLVSVAVPPRAAAVQVYTPSLLRDILLLVQLAAALFAVFTAIPARRTRR